MCHCLLASSVARLSALLARKQWHTSLDDSFWNHERLFSIRDRR